MILSDIQAARGHLSEAELAIRRALDIRPTYAYGHFNLGTLLLERGDKAGAPAEIQQEKMDDGRWEGMALVYHSLGKKTDADAALARLLRDYANGNPLDMAEVYAYRGELDNAIHWLELAYKQKDPFLFQLKRVLRECSVNLPQRIVPVAERRRKLRLAEQHVRTAWSNAPTPANSSSSKTPCSAGRLRDS